jgi:hypothetical protein
MTIREGWPPFDVWQRRRKFKRINAGFEGLGASIGYLVIAAYSAQQAVSNFTQAFNGILLQEERNAKNSNSDHDQHGSGFG